MTPVEPPGFSRTYYAGSALMLAAMFVFCAVTGALLLAGLALASIALLAIGWRWQVGHRPSRPRTQASRADMVLALLLGIAAVVLGVLAHDLAYLALALVVVLLVIGIF